MRILFINITMYIQSSVMHYLRVYVPIYYFLHSKLKYLTIYYFKQRLVKYKYSTLINML